MNIFKITRKFKKALRFCKWTAEDTRKANIDLRYASERVVSPEQKLNDARLVFTQIVRMTANNPAIPPKYREAIHKIASEGYEAAK